jgi:hypothetical protein
VKGGRGRRLLLFLEEAEAEGIAAAAIAHPPRRYDALSAMLFQGLNSVSNRPSLFIRSAARCSTAATPPSSSFSNAPSAMALSQQSPFVAHP